MRTTTKSTKPSPGRLTQAHQKLVHAGVYFLCFSICGHSSQVQAFSLLQDPQNTHRLVEEVRHRKAQVRDNCRARCESPYHRQNQQLNLLTLFAEAGDEVDIPIGSDIDLSDQGLDSVAPTQNFMSNFDSTDAFEEIKSAIFTLAILVFVKTFVLEPASCSQQSMYPTVHDNDKVIIEKVTKRIRGLRRNEVVIFSPPKAFQDMLFQKGAKEAIDAIKFLTKRVVAIEGDRVEMRSGQLYVNGAIVNEAFTAEDAQYDYGPVVVPPRNVCVLGDNRNQSLDSHTWGFLPNQNVIGRVVYVYWPPSSAGNKNLF